MRIKVLLITGVICVVFFIMIKNGKNPELVLKVAYPFNHLISSYDPAKIHYDSQYVLLENLYSSLIVYNSDNQLVSGLAERFYWQGNEAWFELRKGVRTVDGYEITAKDVENSFKRLFILGTNTHGDLKKDLCGNVNIKKLSDKCKNLIVKDKYTVVMRFKEHNPFLFSMLTSMDFGIVPEISIDKKTLNITDYRNTSGAYYVDRDLGEGNFILLANHNHFLHKDNTAKVVEIKNSVINGENKSLEMFKKGEVDLITTINGGIISDVLSYHQDNKKRSNLFETYKIHLIHLTFTPTGVKNFSLDERFRIVSLLRKIIISDYKDKRGFEEEYQLFPDFGGGALTKEQLSKITKKINMDVERFDKKIDIWGFPRLAKGNIMDIIKKKFPKAEIHIVRGIPGYVDYKKVGLKEPDIYFSGGDVSIKEDVTLIAYYMSGYFFHIHGEEGKRWIERYKAEKDVRERLKMFNELHYKTLSKCVTVPIGFTPYVAIVKKPWEFDYSRIYAGNPFWRIYWRR